MSNQEELKTADKCSYCGTCLYFCPLYRHTLLDTTAPRGKATLISEYIKGNLTPSQYFRNICNMCILCQRCAENCPSGIDVSGLILDMRSELMHQKIWSSDKGIWANVKGLPGFLHRSISNNLFFYFWFFIIKYRPIYDLTLKITYILQKVLPKKQGMIIWAPYPLQGWTHKRFLKPVAKKTFKDSWLDLKKES